MGNVNAKRERVKLCKNHAIKLLFLHTSFGWRRYTLDNTPILGWFHEVRTACDYVKPGTPCPELATDVFVKTWA